MAAQSVPHISARRDHGTDAARIKQHPLVPVLQGRRRQGPGERRHGAVDVGAVHGASSRSPRHAVIRVAATAVGVEARSVRRRPRHALVAAGRVTGGLTASAGHCHRDRNWG